MEGTPEKHPRGELPTETTIGHPHRRRGRDGPGGLRYSHGETPLTHHNETAEDPDQLNAKSQLPIAIAGRRDDSPFTGFCVIAPGIMSPLFLLIILATTVVSLWASYHVKTTFARFFAVPASSGVTGAEAALRILGAADIRDVDIVSIPGSMTDHYDPVNKRLALSEETYQGTSLSSLGVAAHEAGHALQHQEGFAMLEARMGLAKVAGIASQMVLWIPLLGIISGLLAPRLGLTILALGWGVIMLFQLITLPVEFDASNRAKDQLIDLGLITREERKAVSSVLSAAAWTYVAAFVSSLAIFLSYILPLISGRRH
jgi:uncharacterized protein